MLAGVGKLLSNFKSYYNEINSATLTGAIDIVVVKQRDGTYVSSPFHVRFGKLGVLRSREKVVYIEINGEPIEDLHMKLGDAGEAFFVQEVVENSENPDYLATSPISSSPIHSAVELPRSQLNTVLAQPTVAQNAPVHSNGQGINNKDQDIVPTRRRQESSGSHSSSQSTSSDQSRKDGFKPISQTEDELLESGGMFDIEVSDDDDRLGIANMSLSKSISLPLIHESSRSRVENWTKNPYASSQFHPFSDTDITPITSPVGSRPPTPKSDTEFEVASDRKQKESQLQQWNWGELPQAVPVLPADKVSSDTPQVHGVEETGGLLSFMRVTKNVRHKPTEEGIYLDDLNLQEMDPEVAALYFPSKSKCASKPEACMQKLCTHDDDAESGNGPSLPQSPALVTSMPSGVATPNSDTGTMMDKDAGIYGDIAMSLCGGLKDGSTVIADEVFERSLITYETFCEKPSILQDPNLVIRINGKYYNCAVAAPMILCMATYQMTLPESSQQNLIKELMPNTQNKKQPAAKAKGGSMWWPFSRTRQNDPEAGLTGALSSESSSPGGSPKKINQEAEALSKVSEKREEKPEEKNTADPSKSGGLHVPTVQDSKSAAVIHFGERYKKTLRLTSEQLHRLNLHEGQNEIEFSVTTSLQGTTKCVAHIYLWEDTDTIVVSDIDGTITKSDVLGQILPMIGRDYSQSGVTELYTKIASNGYKFVYLSARAIGQAQITRDYLKSVKQGNSSLPPGPLLLSPSSLINAFHREVIEKKPEEFKISCLKDLQSIFPSSEALYAGFGNKINDIYAYRAVGIAKCRIFLINPHGQLKSDYSHTFQSTYSNLSDVVDLYFPPLKDVGHASFHAPNDFSDFTYWREPVPEIDIKLASL